MSCIVDTQENAQVAFDPFDLVQLPSGSVQLVDVEEEVFLLYTGLSSRGTQDGTKAFLGLGSIDTKKDTLTLQFDLPDTLYQHDPEPHPHDPSEKSKVTRRRGKKRMSRTERLGASTLDIDLLQNKTTLHSKRGDTGSVLWRVSVELGQILLRQLCSNATESLFKKQKLKDCNVLELGAGTGLLSLLLGPFVRHYTATDLDYLVPLIQKNISNSIATVQLALKHFSSEPSGTIEVKALDWLQANSTPSSRSVSHPLARGDPIDLIIAVDCIYNPSLLQPLIDTVDYFTSPGRTKALVVVELRASDVITDFLQIWAKKGGWTIWRIGGDGLDHPSWLDVGFAAWIGWKSSD